MSARVVTLRSAVDRFNESGEVVTSHLASDFEMHQADSIVDSAGVFRGREALSHALAELRTAFDALRFEVVAADESPDDRVAMIIHVTGRGRGSDIDIDNTIGWVWQFEGELATRLDVFENPEDASLESNATD